MTQQTLYRFQQNVKIKYQNVKLQIKVQKQKNKEETNYPNITNLKK